MYGLHLSVSFKENEYLKLYLVVTVYLQPLAFYVEPFNGVYTTKSLISPVSL